MAGFKPGVMQTLCRTVLVTIDAREGEGGVQPNRLKHRESDTGMRLGGPVGRVAHPPLVHTVVVGWYTAGVGHAGMPQDTGRGRAQDVAATTGKGLYQPLDG